MAIANLQAIITKIRKLAAIPNSQQYTDSVIIDYINSFYLYDFPAEFRSLDLKDIYTFNTIRGIDTYPFDRDHWVGVQGPATIAKREAYLYFDNFAFLGLDFNDGSNEQYEEIIATGDGTAGSPYTATLQSIPILRSVNNNPEADTQTSNLSVFPAGYPPTFIDSNIGRVQNILITASNSMGSTQNVTDDGNGNLIGDAVAGSTIDYETGAVSLTFTAAVDSGIDIVAFYRPIVMNQPLNILFYQNQFTLRPVPDKGYTVQITGYRLPSDALLGTTSTITPDLDGRPEIKEWWECIAVGASKKIYEDRLDMEGVAMMDKMLQERYQVCYTRTYANLGKKRMHTIYEAQLNIQNYNDPSGFTTNIG